MYNSIHQSAVICNSLKEKNIYKKFSEKVMKHIITILISIYCLGYQGKTINFANHSDNHRTTIAYFLNPNFQFLRNMDIQSIQQVISF